VISRKVLRKSVVMIQKDNTEDITPLLLSFLVRIV
jgi:hypothetical protein